MKGLRFNMNISFVNTVLLVLVVLILIFGIYSVLKKNRESFKSGTMNLNCTCDNGQVKKDSLMNQKYIQYSPKVTESEDGIPGFADGSLCHNGQLFKKNNKEFGLCFPGKCTQCGGKGCGTKSNREKMGLSQDESCCVNNIKKGKECKKKTDTSCKVKMIVGGPDNQDDRYMKVNHSDECQMYDNIDPASIDKASDTTCNDNHRFCQQWAARGECDKNPVYMKEMCKVSCGVCPCENPSCKKWADDGECTKNPGYMKKLCKKSCGLCPE